VRFIIQAVMLVALFSPKLGFRMIITPSWRTQVLRGIALVASSVPYFYALRTIPLADATAIVYTTPVLVVLYSALVLKERLTGARIAFVVAGFLGMVLIIRPGAEMFQEAALLALLAAAMYAVFQVLTRTLHGDDARVTLAFPALIGVIVITPVVLLSEYPLTMSLADAALLLLSGVVGTSGHFMFIRAFKSAPVSVLSPFTYSQLVWATVFGLIVFGQFPDAMALAGIALIAGSGALLAWHERRRAQGALALREPGTPE
jgi:drug/metabolite transporter (DMT)-like permease